MLARLKAKLLSKIRNLLTPTMISGFTRFDGVEFNNIRIGNTTYIGSLEDFYIEDNVFIGHYCVIDASNKITIKEGCQICSFVSINTHSSHISIRLYGNQYMSNDNLKGYVVGSVYIGKYTFVGPYSIIMPNTIIGKGCIVSAYSYVQGNFPEFSFISGNPARVVGDIRRIDAIYLKKYPELTSYYDAWAQST